MCEIETTLLDWGYKLNISGPLDGPEYYTCPYEDKLYRSINVNADKVYFRAIHKNSVGVFLSCAPDDFHKTFTEFEQKCQVFITTKLFTN